MSLDFTFLTKEQIWGDKNGNEPLSIIERYGTRVAPTDLAIILGVWMTHGGERTSENDLTCQSWSASSEKEGNVYCIHWGGWTSWLNATRRDVSVRPVLPSSETSKIKPSKTKGGIFRPRIAEYGEYPQTVADDETCEKLESLHSSRSLRPTGKKYTFDSGVDYASGRSFRATSYPEYELDGKRYIRVPGRPADGDSVLSTGEELNHRKHYWVEVQPIEWLVDKTGTWIAKKALFAGIQFDTKEKYDGDFSKTSMKRYLDTYFAKEIEPPERQEEREKRLKREETIKGLKSKLAEAIDPQKVKAKVGFTRTESRREIVEAIKTTRRARDVFITAGKKAQKEGDQELIDQIVEMADFYVRSDQAQRRAAHQRRATSRTQRTAAQKDSQR